MAVVGGWREGAAKGMNIVPFEWDVVTSLGSIFFTPSMTTWGPWR